MINNSVSRGILRIDAECFNDLCSNLAGDGAIEERDKTAGAKRYIRPDDVRIFLFDGRLDLADALEDVWYERAEKTTDRCAGDARARYGDRCG